MKLDYARSSPSPEDFADFIQAVLDDQHLTQWLLGLESLSPRSRNACIEILVDRMAAASDRPQLMQVVRSLERPDILGAVLQAVRENL